MNDSVDKEDQYKQALMDAILDINDLESKLEAYSEPVAIIGMSCRFPGGANTPAEYWDLLHQGRDAISEIPKNRWNADDFYDPNIAEPGKMISKLGGFLDIDVSNFDANFFGISPREAEYLDPQQRLLLEVCYEAILSSGIDPKTLKNTKTGVFMGVCSHDYVDLFTAKGDKTLINPYLATGNLPSTATGRISYFLGLRGPNYAIDTACSSSLVAIDVACKNLRSHDADLALAGGVALILTPDYSIDFSKAGMLAPDGHCKTFDARADGYVRGEGCGVIVLKRFNDALRDGDPILGLIKASNINQDGASSGLTVPNGDAQEALIRNVLKQAKLKASDINYVEAHGTGTSLGDPIEVRALGATYGERESINPLRMGSVKTNIGHLEGAAGIASVIKVILALYHETLPATLHFNTLNPHINSNFPLEIVTQNQKWSRCDTPRRAGISSFGFSGTNAHLIIEEGPQWSQEQHEQWKTRSLNRPNYQRERFWIEGITPRLGRKLQTVHPLLGERIDTPDNQLLYFGDLHLDDLNYLSDHQVFEQIIYPGAGYIEMMLAAGSIALEQRELLLTEVSIEAALSFKNVKSINAQVLMKPCEQGYEISIYTGEKGKWQRHAKGIISLLPENTLAKKLDIEEIKSRCTTPLNPSEFYQTLSTRIYYGPEFQTLTKIDVGHKEALGELQCSSSIKDYLAHPSLLDGALQLLGTEKLNDLFLPVGCDLVEFYSPLPEHLMAYWHETECNEFGRVGDITLCTNTGDVLALIRGMRYRKTTESALKSVLDNSSSLNKLLYEWIWEKYDLEGQPESLGHCLVLAAQSDLEELTHFMTENGATHRLIGINEHPKTKEEFASLIQSESFARIIYLSKASTVEAVNELQFEDVQSLLYLTQALVTTGLKIPLTIITRQNVLQSPIDGFFKTLIIEHPELSLKRVDLETTWSAELITKAMTIPSKEQWLRIRDNRFYVPRLAHTHEAESKRGELVRPADDLFRLQSKDKGLLDNLILAPLELKNQLEPFEVEIEVFAVGLNFRDVLDALGLYPGDPGPMGGDGAGIVRRVGSAVTRLKEGDSVFGLMSGSLSRLAWMHEDNITLMPAGISYTDAAALPTVFLTVHYAFTRATVLRPGDTVLIHAGAGGVGQAAIQIAKHLGANIIVTAGSELKREFIKAQGVAHVFDSRSLSYVEDIFAVTQGRGVDVVLNSLSGEGFIDASVRVCAPNARFLEIGKRDIWSVEQMQSHRPDIAYHIIALDTISETNPKEIQSLL